MRGDEWPLRNIPGALDLQEVIERQKGCDSSKDPGLMQKKKAIHGLCEHFRECWEPNPLR